MPLNPVDRPGIETPTGIHFGMVDGDKGVRVFVDRDVLRNLAGASADKAALVAKFNLYRRQFEAIASEKYDRGQKSPVTVTQPDIIRFAAEQRPDEFAG
jgi:Protein of unknown function (DUF1488)